MGKLKDLTGQRFGRLTVIKRAENKYGRATWLCQCDCGNQKEVQSWNLVSGQTKSCGCNHYSHDIQKDKALRHGSSYDRLYTIWIGMKQRCYYAKHKQFKHYGGRGITVCDEWKDDFQAFHDWSTSHGYSNNLTIDRIDNDKGYSPDNCRWVSMKEQNNNRRNNRNIEFNGEIHSISEWSVITGIPRTTIRNRINRGWTIEKTLTTKGS